MNEEIAEYYEELYNLCAVEQEQPLARRYRQLREALERVMRQQMMGTGLQATDLAARINYVATQFALDGREQNQLHTFRLTSNDILNHRKEPSEQEFLRDLRAVAYAYRKIFHEDIPPKLYTLLPKQETTPAVKREKETRIRRIRVCFDYADESYLYVRPIDVLEEEPVKVNYNKPGVNEEFKDTVDELWRYAQLNLLDVTVDDNGVYTPSFIVLEPDYLLDISSLAECYKDYGSHPANYFLSRLVPIENARPLLLGNIANLFLDEWIYAGEKEPDYKKAFRQYPIELAACEELRNPQKEKEFAQDCRMHFEHIRETVQKTFLQPGYNLDKNDAVLEPSYICEALGIQGRLDYMQRDMSSFIEMKSGKADEYAMQGRLEPKENNRVQMLLYMAVLEYSMGQERRSMHPYLLYTRYPLLYPARASWAQVRRIINLRNCIVASEYGVQLHNHPSFTQRLLAQINPSVLNQKGLQGRFWEQYLKPSISRFGERMELLTPLERTYFYTLYNFITKELYTSKSGDVNCESRTGASALWLSTLDEKRDAGEILYDLTIVENHASQAHKAFIILSIPQYEETFLPNFRNGDVVVLYERNNGTDNVTNKMVFKGNIESITDNELRIRLRAAQQNPLVFPENSRYAVEHDTMDTTFRSMYLGLSSFMDANPERRELLLGQRPPRFDMAYEDRIARTTDDFERVALKAEAACDYFLLVGPPGTGKTSRALRRMVEHFYACPSTQVLLLAYTNRAVDEICRSLSAILPQVDYIRVGSELSCDARFRKHLLENVLAECNNRREVNIRMADCRIYVGTVASIASKPELFKLKHFDVAIVDEATQILEPQLLGILCARFKDGRNGIGKFILIGDHKQLPAVVLQSNEQSEVHDEGLRRIGLYNLKDSLFERLYRNAISQQAVGGRQTSAFNSRFSAFNSLDMLCRQGRMNVEVAAFPNRAFYGGLLQPVGLEHQTGVLKLSPQLSADEFAALLTRRVAFLPSVPEPPMQSAKMNRSEAKIVAGLAAAVYRQYTFAEGCFSAASTLGVITPYRSQIALIKKEIEALEIPALNEILVDTVERFQGSERDVIIYSFCVNRLSQLRFLANLTEENGIRIDRKLNVALTRARKQMFIIGVRQLLEQNPIYAQLLKSCDS